VWRGKKEGKKSPKITHSGPKKKSGFADRRLQEKKEEAWNANLR